jgi:hypothetical protein
MSRKRAADSFEGAAAAASPPPRSTRAKASAPGALSEGALSGEEEPPALKKQRVDREFWEQFVTEVLYTWLADYNPPPVTREDKGNREKLLQLLVLTEGVERPAKGREAKELQACWKRIEGLPSRSPAPQVWVAAPKPQEAKYPEHVQVRIPGASSPMAMSFASSDEDDDPDPPPPQAHSASAPPPSSSVPAPVARSLPLLPLSQPSLGFQMGEGSPPPRQQQALPPPPPVVRPRPCLTCAMIGPAAETWRCTGCDLRGDLPTDAKANEFLAKKASEAAASSSSSSSSGQSHAETQAAAAAKEAIKGLDLDFSALAARGPTLPI